jgi:hypothetical protein
MRILWTLLKVIIGLAVAIPLAIVALGLTLGLVGTLLGLAIVALKLACLAFFGYGVFRVARHLFGPRRTPPAPIVHELSAPTDRYYEAAMRELDAELHHRGQ